MAVDIPPCSDRALAPRPAPTLQQTAGQQPAADARKFVHSFERAGGYVADAQWSPVHPAVFASADASGLVQLWNINRDVRRPAFSFRPAAEAGGRATALSRLRWSLDGRRIALGDVGSGVCLLGVHPDFYNIREDDGAEIDATIARLARGSGTADASGVPQ